MTPEPPTALPATAPTGRPIDGLTVAMLYAAFGALWILMSDTALGWLVQDRDTLLLLSTIKGWLFVMLSSLLLYVVVARPGWPLVSRRSTARQLPWGMLLVLAGAIMAVTGAALLQSWNQETQRIETRLRSIATEKANRLADWHEERMNTARQLQHERWVAQLWEQWHQQPSPEVREALGERLNRLTLGLGVKRVEVFDSQGARVWPQPVHGVAADPSMTAGLQHILQTRQAQAWGPWRDATSALRLAYIGLIAPDSNQPGLVVLHVDPPEHFHPTLREWPEASGSGEAFLFRRLDDRVQLLSEPRQDPGAAVRRTLPLSTSELLSARFLRGEIVAGTLAEGTDYRGVPAYGVILPIAGTDWYLLTKQDRYELLGTAVRNGATLVLAGLLGLLSAFTAAYLLLQRRLLAQREANIQVLETSRRHMSDSEARYRLLAENARDAVWLLDIATLRLVYISPVVEQLLGYTPEEMYQMALADILEADDLPKALEWLDHHVRRFNAGDAQAATDTIELAHRHKNGSPVAMELSVRLVPDDSGRATQVQGVSRDISERKQAELQIRKLSQATSQSPVAVLITSPKAVIEYVNPAFERMSGYSASEVVGHNPRLLQSRRTPRDTYRRMWDALGRGETWQGELINRHKDGRHYLQSVTIAPLRDERGQVMQYISVQMDITAQRAAEDRAELLVWFDPLTGLPNRQRLLSDLADLLKRRPSGQYHGLLLINIDRFKTVNEARGHGMGDQLLQVMGRRLHELLEGGDMLAHLNGDEFALLVQGLEGDHTTVSAELLQRAEGIHEIMRHPLAIEQDEVILSVSIGIAMLGPDTDETAGDILRHADTALHRAKDAGGQQTALFDSGMGRLVSERFAIEQDLRRGIEAGELRLFLQPQVDSHGLTSSAEALVRWEHPHQGLVAPGLFIPVAEDSGLIDGIGQWVLERVCIRLGALRRMGKRLPIAVNISPSQFHQSDFEHKVLSMLHAHGADPGDLILEITEGVVVRDVESVIGRMGALTRHGVRFSIDDFGTGYSSLSYLKNLPIHELKIDRSFVQDAPSNPSDAALVGAILSVARHLQLRVVAEGVETSEQAAFFTRHPGVLMQGYLYGRPEHEDTFFERWLDGASGVTQANGGT